eukprot:6395137-Alexandrium_andersonii.AAC.1
MEALGGKTLALPLVLLELLLLVLLQLPAHLPPASLLLAVLLRLRRGQEASESGQEAGEAQDRAP